MLTVVLVNVQVMVSFIVIIVVPQSLIYIRNFS
jgi:hypothetical protein